MSETRKVPDSLHYHAVDDCAMVSYGIVGQHEPTQASQRIELCTCFKKPTNKIGSILSLSSS